MKQWDLLHLPIHMCPQKFSQNSRRHTAVCEWKKFHRYEELHDGVGQRATWYLTYKCCLGNTKGVNSCEKSYLKLVFQDMSVGFLQTMNKKKRKDQKRSCLLWIWEIVLLSEERNFWQNLKNNNRKKTFGLTALFLHTRWQCLSEHNWLTQRNTGRDSRLEGANSRYGKDGGWVAIDHWIASTCPLSDVSGLSHRMIFKDFYLSLSAL